MVMSGLPTQVAQGGDAELADALGRIALRAAAVVMRAYDAHVPVRLKSDASPVCEADESSEAIILDSLAHLFPAIPVVAEEAVSRGIAPEIGREFFLVDPLDGTREFAARNGEFTVNIALIRDGAPVCGAVCAPVAQRLWLATPNRATFCIAKPGEDLPRASKRSHVRGRSAHPNDLAAFVSRSNLDPTTEAWLAKRSVRHRTPVGSSIKFCLLASGEADLYPRFGPTMEWDTAAGDAVLRAAGGFVLDETGQLMRYGKVEQSFRNPGFVAWADQEAARQLG